MLWNDVLMRQSFTALGAARFSHDVMAIQSVVDGSCAIYRGVRGADLRMDKLNEAVIVLNLPLHDEVS